MENGFGTAALRWWAALVQARSTGPRARTRPDGRHLALPHDPAAPLRAHPLGMRLAGAPEVLTRLATVQLGTVAVLLRAGRPEVVMYPGELLVPPLLTRTPAAARALALSTPPVHLDVTVPGLVTLDRFTLEVVRLRLELQLDSSDGYAAVAALAAQHGARLETVLLDQVHRECVAAVQGAVRMNRQVDLQRLTLRRVLSERWLPAAFAGGVLLRRDVQVLEAGESGEPRPAGPDDEPTVVLPAAGGPGPPAPATEEAAPMASAT